MNLVQPAINLVAFKEAQGTLDAYAEIIVVGCLLTSIF